MAQPQGPITRDADRSREAILEAATDVFAQLGYNQTTLQLVGERSGLSRGTPGYFFGSKEALYRAVLDRAFGEARDALRSADEEIHSAGLDQEEGFRRSIGAYIDFLAAHPRFVSLVQWEALGHGGALREHPRHLELALDSLAEVGQYFAEDLPAVFDTTQLLLSIMGLCWFPIAHRDTLGAVLGVDTHDREFLEARKRHVADLVLAGIKGDGRLRDGSRK